MRGGCRVAQLAEHALNGIGRPERAGGVGRARRDEIVERRRDGRDVTLEAA
jgi:hypothetical protein